MSQEPVTEQALARFEQVPADQARLLEMLAVHHWFTVDIVAYTAADLGTDVTPEEVVASPLVVEDRVPYPEPEDGPRYGIRSTLRTALTDRMRTERPTTYHRAHRIAATYYHQPLEPLRTDRLAWYVHEVRHLAAFRTEQAAERLAAFAHSALAAGYAEAAGRAAAGLAAASPAPADQALAGIIKAVAQILNAPAHVEHGTVVLLDDHLARYGTPADPTVTRLVLLARDLVVHYTERPAPVTPLTAMVVPEASTTIDPRGMPVLGGELRLLEDMTQPSRTITTRTHRVELPSSTVAAHQITTRLATEDRPGRSMVLADVLPGDRWDRLDVLQLHERGVGQLNVLRASETVRAVARGVGRLLDSGESGGNGENGGNGDDREEAAGSSTRAELSRQLNSVGWHSGTDELTALLRRTRQAEDVEGFLRDRVAGLMRYTPVVALLDVYPGLPSEVTYGYEEDYTTHRLGLLGLGGVVVSMTLTLPLEVRNRLEFAVPDGLEFTGVRATEGVRLLPARTGGTTSRVEQFDIETDGGDDEHMAHVTVDVSYRLTDRDFMDVMKTAGLSMLISLLALLLLIADTALVPVVGSIVASVVAVLDLTRDGVQHDTNVPLHVFAGRRLRVLRRSNAVVAIAAATAPNADSLVGSFFASGVAFMYCLLTCVVVLGVRDDSRRLLYATRSATGPATRSAPRGTLPPR
ncbi:hypothetical protein [Streptomyces sp. HPF1205]|uniref:hypothetical protein n=1 Tax=Streptomyces sp. HPF1205 TaxID=2873262 RepID=UPI001CEC09BF|nr:hypothetical protein [Streptomyces sp. HPF1205]